MKKIIFFCFILFLLSISCNENTLSLQGNLAGQWLMNDFSLINKYTWEVDSVNSNTGSIERVFWQIRTCNESRKRIDWTKQDTIPGIVFCDDSILVIFYSYDLYTLNKNDWGIPFHYSFNKDTLLLRNNEYLEWKIYFINRFSFIAIYYTNDSTILKKCTGRLVE